MIKRAAENLLISLQNQRRFQTHKGTAIFAWKILQQNSDCKIKEKATKIRVLLKEISQLHWFN